MAWSPFCWAMMAEAVEPGRLAEARTGQGHGREHGHGGVEGFKATEEIMIWYAIAVIGAPGWRMLALKVILGARRLLYAGYAAGFIALMLWMGGRA